MEYNKQHNVIDIDHTDPEYELMWSALFAKYENYSCERSLEVWQYMGTWNTESTGGQWMHQFRHRSYQSPGNRVCVNIPVSAECLEKIEQLIKETK